MAFLANNLCVNILMKCYLILVPFSIIFFYCIGAAAAFKKLITPVPSRTYVEMDKYFLFQLCFCVICPSIYMYEILDFYLGICHEIYFSGSSPLLPSLPSRTGGLGGLEGEEDYFAGLSPLLPAVRPGRGEAFKVQVNIGVDPEDLQ